MKIQQECHKIPGAYQHSRRASCHTRRFSSLYSENMSGSNSYKARLKHKGSLPGSKGWLSQDRPDCSLLRGPDSAGVFWPLCSSQTMLLHYADVTRWPPNTASSYCSARPKVVHPHHSWSGCDSFTSTALVISHQQSGGHAADGPLILTNRARM